MPLVRYQIQAAENLAAPELYKRLEADADPAALLESAHFAAGLVGLVRQLGELARYSTTVFGDLHNELVATSVRSKALAIRVRCLEEAVPDFERKSTLADGSLVQPPHKPGNDWESRDGDDHDYFKSSNRPAFVSQLYNSCRSPPDFSTLDRFAEEEGTGAECKKQYSDSSFFRRKWANMELARAEKDKREMAARRGKRKGRRLRTLSDAFEGGVVDLLPTVELSPLVQAETLNTPSLTSSRTQATSSSAVTTEASDNPYGSTTAAANPRSPTSVHLAAASAYAGVGLSAAATDELSRESNPDWSVPLLPDEDSLANSWRVPSASSSSGSLSSIHPSLTPDFLDDDDLMDADLEGFQGAKGGGGEGMWAVKEVDEEGEEADTAKDLTPGAAPDGGGTTQSQRRSGGGTRKRWRRKVDPAEAPADWETRRQLSMFHLTQAEDEEGGQLASASTDVDVERVGEAEAGVGVRGTAGHVKGLAEENIDGGLQGGSSGGSHVADGSADLALPANQSTREERETRNGTHAEALQTEQAEAPKAVTMPTGLRRLQVRQVRRGSKDRGQGGSGGAKSGESESGNSAKTSKSSTGSRPRLLGWTSAPSTSRATAGEAATSSERGSYTARSSDKPVAPVKADKSVLVRDARHGTEAVPAGTGADGGWRPYVPPASADTSEEGTAVAGSADKPVAGAGGAALHSLEAEGIDGSSLPSNGKKKEPVMATLLGTGGIGSRRFSSATSSVQATTGSWPAAVGERATSNGAAIADKSQPEPSPPLSPAFATFQSPLTSPRPQAHEFFGIGFFNSPATMTSPLNHPLQKSRPSTLSFLLLSPTQGHHPSPSTSSSSHPHPQRQPSPTTQSHSQKPIPTPPAPPTPPNPPLTATDPPSRKPHDPRLRPGPSQTGTNTPPSHRRTPSFIASFGPEISGQQFMQGPTAPLTESNTSITAVAVNSAVADSWGPLTDPSSSVTAVAVNSGVADWTASPSKGLGAPPPPPPPPTRQSSHSEAALARSLSGLVLKEISSHDRSKMKRVESSERQPRPRQPLDDRDILLEQIRSGVVLRRAEHEKKVESLLPSSDSLSNLSVAQIFQKANSIRQAFVGSDDDEEDDEDESGSDWEDQRK